MQVTALLGDGGREEQPGLRKDIACCTLYLNRCELNLFRLMLCFWAEAMCLHPGMPLTSLQLLCFVIRNVASAKWSSGSQVIRCALLSSSNHYRSLVD